MLELELGIVLMVFHLPSLVTITQGTDSLSQGIWMSNLHAFVNERRMLAAIFAPTAFHFSLVHLIRNFLPEASPQFCYYDWKSPW